MWFLTSLKISIRGYSRIRHQKLHIPVIQDFYRPLTMADSTVDIHGILRKHSTDKYFIEYDGFLSNHLSHGAIALSRLGMSRDRIEHFISKYTSRLEPVTNDPADTRPPQELKGERVAFYSILKHYESLLQDKYDNNIDDLIRNEYPKVSEGLGSSALHGTIHLGYGYSVKNDRTVLEGLAYTFHSFRPISTSRGVQELARFGHGNVEITDVLTKLLSNTSLQQQMYEGIKEERWKPLKLGKFQIAVTYLTADHADLLTDLLLSVKFDSNSFLEDGSLDPVRCMRQVVHWTVLVYALASARNNFFLLHGVTCAWSLQQIIPLLKKDDGVKVIREFLTVILSVYVSQGCPELNIPALTGEFDENDWSALVKKATDVDRDEHCYKLVQVCQEMVKDARAFGENPNVYMQAAKSVLENEFVYHP